MKKFLFESNYIENQNYESYLKNNHGLICNFFNKIFLLYLLVYVYLSYNSDIFNKSLHLLVLFVYGIIEAYYNTAIYKVLFLLFYLRRYLKVFRGAASCLGKMHLDLNDFKTFNLLEIINTKQSEQNYKTPNKLANIFFCIVFQFL